MVKKIGLTVLILIILGLTNVHESRAILGTIKGYTSPSGNSVKVGDKFSVKIMLDSGTNRLSVVSLNLSLDTAKIKVNSVTMNRAVFNGVFRETAVGGVVSLYGTSSMTTTDLPKGIIEVGTVNLEAVAAGYTVIDDRDFEITGPSNSNDYSYGLNWQPGTVEIGNYVIIPTATPTSIPGNGTDGVLKFKVAFAGVTAVAQCASNWPVDVTVIENGGNSRTYNRVTLATDGSGQVLLSGISSKSNLAVFVKGPRHLQIKYADNGQDEYYNQPGGNISVTTNPNTTTVYDFTKYPLLAGDVNRDGAVDGLDFSVVKSEVNKRTSGDGLVADLNGNCQLESQDLSLLMLAMKDRQEQLY